MSDDGISPAESASSTKKAAKKVVKKAAKKTAKKTKKKTTKKAASKPADGVVAKKAAKKTGKKTTKKAKKKASKKGVKGIGKNLVIVESPAKAKTINKYLGSSYVVKASVGHVRDLPKSRLAIDVENNFKPDYMTIRGKKDVINELKAYAKGAKKVYLATDPDREGEAIAWHLGEALELDSATTHRVTFNEITKAAIQRAFEQPREIAMDVVNAQQARRVLDRLVGYSISPILWRKIATGLSAGRVQSVALRLISEREREIEAFNPEEYWTISAWLMKLIDDAALSPADRTRLDAALAAFHGDDDQDADDGKIDSEDEVEQETSEDGETPAKPKLPRGIFRADLKKWQGETPKISSETEANAILNAIKGKQFKVASVEIKERKDRPKSPFITSTLQQQASTRLGFSARRTMRVAQDLYEGVDLGEEGSTGLITYMRTDSVHLSDFAMNEAREVIEGTYGKEYMPEERVIYKTNSKAQAAHEAIRPTSAFRTPKSVASFLAPEQLKLYTLIWERFLACQMVPAVYEITTMDIEVGDALFRLSGRRLAFDGHAAVSGIRLAKGEQELPKLEAEEKLVDHVVKGDQHFTSPPPRFSEASLVKTLEKLGIGRPSTYAAIISTIADRGYVRNESRRFFTTELGLIVNDMLVGNFSRIVDSEFTAKMEAQLDKVEEGDLDWVDVMRNFYELFKDELAEAEEKIEKIKGVPAQDAAGEPVPCPLCTKEMVVRWSKEGKFFGCVDYPECKGTLPLDADGNPIQLTAEDIECPSCQESMVVRMSKRGPFLGCSTFPKCRGTRAIEALKGEEERAAEEQFAGLICDKCSSPMKVRVSRGKPFLGCTGYPECRNAMSAKKAEEKLAAGELRIDEKARAEFVKDREDQLKRQESLSVAS